MNVKEAVKALMDLPEDAELSICGHEFEGMENMGWVVQGFSMSHDGRQVAIEGACPIDKMLTATDGQPQEVPD